MRNIVTTDWLRDNLLRNEIVVLDVRSELGNANYGLEAYKTDHIEGSVYVSVEELLTGKVTEHGGRHPLPDLSRFVEDMNSLGVDDETEIVVYDDGDLSMAGRLWWMLRFIGKENVKVLAGGIKEWKDNGFPVTSDEVIPRSGNGLTLNIQESMESSMEDVRASFTQDGTAVIDSRSTERFRGEEEPIDPVAGHIPGALNYPWSKLTEGGRILEMTDLEAHFAPLRKFDKLIVHCGSGITATVNAMFMEEVGLQPTVYVGSWSDWITYEDNEVVVEA
jgi:thiosulfate/3-mercaptopyruvate sulfurtransferase